jgi:AGZA family xanthine/uracil permease-like MFS transporter
MTLDRWFRLRERGTDVGTEVRGLVAVVTGLLFLVAMWFSPLASVIPAEATAPALIIVGLYMMSVAREVAWDDVDRRFPPASPCW